MHDPLQIFWKVFDSVVNRTNKSLAISFRILSPCPMSSVLFAKIKFLTSKQVKTPQSFTFFCLGHLGGCFFPVLFLKKFAFFRRQRLEFLPDELAFDSVEYSSVRTWGATDRVVNVNTKIYDTNDDKNPMFFPRKVNRYHYIFVLPR